MTSQIDSPDSIIKILGMDKDDISFIHLNGRYGYKDCLQFNCISILFNGREDMGVCLEMSGQGCRAFEQYGCSDWSVFFSLVLNDKHNYSVTRLDVAYDDFQGLLDIKKISQSILQGNYVSIFKERSMGVYFSGKGTTVYIGSNTSNVSFCIYDKARERNRVEEIPHWIRWEIHLSDNMALSFLAFFSCESDIIGHIFKSICYKYIRFVKPLLSDSNKKRWSVQKWYLNFLGNAEKISLYTPCDTEYNLKRCEDFVYRQAGNAVDTLIRIKGIDTVVNELKARKPSPRAKYEALVMEYGDSDNLLIKAELENMKKECYV